MLIKSVKFYAEIYLTPGCGVNSCIRLDSGDGNNNNNVDDTEANDWLMVLAASHKYTGPTNNNNNEGDLSNR